MEARFAGCAAVLRGPVCLLGPERRLTVWVRQVPGVAFEVRAAGKALQAVVADVEGGRRFQVEVPPAATALDVVPRGARGRWTLPLGEAHALPVVVAAKAQHAKGETDAAIARLEAALSTVAAERRGEVLGQLGRLERRRGRLEAAFAHLRAAIAANTSHGRVSAAVNDGFALAFFLTNSALRLAEARAVLTDSVAPLVSAYDEGAAALPYYLALVAAKTGDLRTALRQLREAVAATTAVGLFGVRRYAMQILAVHLQVVGRSEDALQTLDALGGEMARVEAPCEKARILDNVAWVRLLGCEAARPRPCAIPLATAERSTALCPAGAVAWANLAHAQLLSGQLVDAHESIDTARATERLDDHTRVWLDDLEGRVALARGDAARAQTLYTTLEGRGRAARTPDVVWRAVVGQARAHRAAGRTAEALDAYARAEHHLDDLAVALPLQDGRATFLGDRARATRDHVDALLRAGRVESAFAVARRARARAVRHLQRLDRLGRLTPEERRRWDAAISAYRRHARDAGSDPAAARQLLDDAFAVLAEAPRNAALRAPAPGELWLAYHPLPEGWVAFAVLEGRVVAERVGELPDDLPALAKRLLEPFDTQLSVARRVRVLPYGRLRDVDFHALAWRGRPLVASLPVAYPLDLAVAPVRPVPGRRAVVVSDPRGDLPGANREARAVSEALQARSWTVTTLAGAEATSARLQQALAGAGLLHYAGHGVFAGRGGWDSALRLADRNLTVGGVLALPEVPRRVVLSGCETARTARNAPLAGVGLAHAFLTSGAEEAVAAVRPIDDELATRMVRVLYEAGDAQPLDVALRAAQLQVLGEEAAEGSGRVRGLGAAPKRKGGDWAAFRALVR